jgi:CHASE2 domain
MQYKKNLKHICIISLFTLLSIWGVMRIFGADFSVPITHFFVYREGSPLLDRLYRYRFTPSRDIAIIKIDDVSLNTLQAKSDLKTLTIEKSTYTTLIEKLEYIGVKGIAFDIVFQNKDPGEKVFADTLTKYPNIVIATTVGDTTECIKDRD